MSMPNLPPWEFHAAWVHFPIALLLTGFVSQIAWQFKPQHDWLRPASAALLWSGTLAVYVAVGLGLLAERTAPHVPLAWEVFADHKELGLWTAGFFTVLSLVRIFTSEKHRTWVTILWIVGAGLIAATAYEGGELVFHYGMGVVGS